MPSSQRVANPLRLCAFDWRSMIGLTWRKKSFHCVSLTGSLLVFTKYSIREDKSSECYKVDIWDS